MSVLASMYVSDIPLFGCLVFNNYNYNICLLFISLIYRGLHSSIQEHCETIPE